MATYSIIIKNGTIFDGSGGPSKEADIGIDDDKIKAIGDLKDETASLIIDASDKYVAPGFIDITTHSDTHWTLFSQPSQESFIRQGVTTIIGGHGGSSLAPLVKGENIETIQKWVDISKINVNWQSMGEFLSELERHPIGVNFGTFVGFGTIRRGILDEQSRPAKKDEIKQMEYLAERSLDEGAFGISTNLGAAHQNSASNEEILQIFKVAEKRGALTVHHLENEGKNLLPALAHLISLARNSGVRSHINHFKAVGKSVWASFPQGLEMVEQAHKEKVQLTCDFFPYTKTGSNLYMLLPEWAIESGKEKILSFINGKERKYLLDFLKDLTLHYEKITIASTLHDLDVVGKNLLELSQKSGISPEETILDLLNVNELQVSIFSEAISEENIEILAAKDYSMVASDGVGYEGNYRSKTDLPHPRSFGAFCRVLSHFVREKEILDWPNAIYKMTGFPAKILGIADRGILKENTCADIVVFDPKTVEDKANYINPYQFPKGIEYVLINGGIVLKENALTAVDQGRILRPAGRD
jgi:N-acyl-D-amino-acid deacylase